VPTHVSRCRCRDEQHSVAACLALACDYELDKFFMKCRTFFLENLDTLSRSDKEGRTALQAQLADGGRRRSWRAACERPVRKAEQLCSARPLLMSCAFVTVGGRCIAHNSAHVLVAGGEATGCCNGIPAFKAACCCVLLGLFAPLVSVVIVAVQAQLPHSCMSAQARVPPAPCCCPAAAVAAWGSTAQATARLTSSCSPVLETLDRAGFHTLPALCVQCPCAFCHCWAPPVLRARGNVCSF
jgi:hypothetical protein